MTMQTRAALKLYPESSPNRPSTLMSRPSGDFQTAINDSEGGILHLAPGVTYTLPVGDSLSLPTDSLIIECK